MGKKKKISRGEIDALIALIKQEAIATSTHEVFLKHDEIAPVFAEDHRGKKIINFWLKDELEEKDIKFAYSPDGYTFTCPPSFSNEATVSKQEVTTKTDEEQAVLDKVGARGLTILDHRYINSNHSGPLRAALSLRDKRGYIICRPMITGPVGCGKSLMCEQVASKLRHPNKQPVWGPGEILRTSLATIQDKEDLIGGLVGATETDEDGNGKVGVTKFVDGILTLCARKGYCLILDEIDKLTPQGAQGFQTITESDGKLFVVTEEGTVSIPIHKNFAIIATANTEGYGDTSEGNFFPDAEVQNASLLDRFFPKFHMDYEETTERTIISSLVAHHIVYLLYGIHRTMGMDESAIDAKDVGLIPVLRESCRDGTIQAQLSLRTVIHFCQLMPTLGWHQAAQSCFVNNFPPAFREIVLDIFKARLGENLRPNGDPTFVPRNQHIVDTLNSEKLPLPMQMVRNWQTFTDMPIEEEQ